jgi:O-antigen/teichoic acid export membrane protein
MDSLRSLENSSSYRSRHSLTAGILAVSVLNFAANVAVARLIAPAEYGAVGSLLALATLVAVPLTSIQPAVTRQVATAGIGRVRLRAPGFWTLVGGCFIILVTVAIASPIDRLLHLSGIWPILLAGTYIAAILIEGVPRGALVGVRRFATVAVVITVGAIVRLAIATIWAAAASGSTGPLAGAAIGELATAAALYLALLRFYPPGPQDQSLKFRDIWLSAAGYTGLLSLMSIDTVAARHWLSGGNSGLYAAASIAGSIAYFMPAAAASAVFPDVAAGIVSKDGRSFAVGLVEVSALALVTAGALTAGGHIVIAVMFPSGYADSRSALNLLAFSYALLGILGYLVSHHLAHTSRTIYLPWIGAVFLLGLVFVAHGSVTSIAWDALASTGMLTFIMGGASVYLERRNQREDQLPSLSTVDEPSAP